MITGFTAPFSCRSSGVYNLIEDSEGMLFCFIAISENMDFNAHELVKILNSLSA